MENCQSFFTVGEQKIFKIFSRTSELIAFHIQFMALRTRNLKLLICEHNESEASRLETKTLFELHVSTQNNRYF